VKCEKDGDVLCDSRLCPDKCKGGEGEGGKPLDTIGFPVIIWGLIPPIHSTGSHAWGGRKSGLG